MNDVLMALKDLQEIDDGIRADRLALEQGAALRREAGQKLAACESRLAAAKEELEDLRRRHRDLEAEVADLAEKQRKNEARRLTAQNESQFAALDREALFLKTRINDLEDETLEVIDRMEKREVDLADLEILTREEDAAVRTLAGETEKAAAEARRRLEELEDRRRTVTAGLPEPELRRYDELVRTKGGRAVTATADGLCLACRLGFPPQLYNELQRNEKILNCPNCGRLIYWAGHPDFRPPEPAQQ